MSRMLEIESREKLTLVPASFMEIPKRGDDPLADLLNEFNDYDYLESEVAEPTIITPPTVALAQREDQMMVTLDNQLSALREGLQRMRFYLSDVDNSLQR
ncbi:MAG: hypothetical protein ACLGG0_12875 [Bacteriovoracia bacterium]